jgi:hypothetical protein
MSGACWKDRPGRLDIEQGAWFETGMLRVAPAVCFALAFWGASGLAHNLPGVKPLHPGEGFTIGSMKAIVPVGLANSMQNVIQFDQLRDGSALAFLVVDLNLPSDVAEAHRFQKLAAGLKNTHAILVATPPRSQRPLELGAALVQEKLTLPIIVDDRDVFPYLFGVPMSHSPHYELFDQSQTLVIQNATSLRQKLGSGVTVAEALRALDGGRFVHPEVLPLHPEAIAPNRSPSKT